jgi:hypothetical protein
VPVRSRTGVNIDKMYDNMMNKFRFGNANDPRVYIDEVTMRMCLTHRGLFYRLVHALMQTGDTVRARKALDYSFEMLPGKTVPYEFTATLLAAFYYDLNDVESGDHILSVFANNRVEHLNWYFNLKPQQRRNSIRAIEQQLSELYHVVQIFDEHGRKELFEQYYPIFEQFYRRLN